MTEFVRGQLVEVREKDQEGYLFDYLTKGRITRQNTADKALWYVRTESTQGDIDGRCYHREDIKVVE